jgi:hypothetical protein
MGAVCSAAGRAPSEDPGRTSPGDQHAYPGVETDRAIGSDLHHVLHVHRKSTLCVCRVVDRSADPPERPPTAFHSAGAPATNDHAASRMTGEPHRLLDTVVAESPCATAPRMQRFSTTSSPSRTTSGTGGGGTRLWRDRSAGDRSRTERPPRGRVRHQRGCERPGAERSGGLGVECSFCSRTSATSREVPGEFDVVIALDDVLAHLLDDDDVSRALRSMHGKLEQRGLLLVKHPRLRSRAPRAPAHRADGRRRQRPFESSCSHP